MVDRKLQDAMDEALESVGRREPAPARKGKRGHKASGDAPHPEDTSEPVPASASASVEPVVAADEAPEPAPEEPGAAPEQDPSAALREEVARLKDRLLRTAADFDNYRKRAAREQEEARRYGSQRLLADLLPVIDNLERALAQRAAGASEQFDTLLKGVELVRQQLLDTLGRHGVTRFDAIGQVFDPNLHEAVGQCPSDAVPAGQVLEQHQAGYRHHERLLRPALVIVATTPAAAAGVAESAEG